MWNFDSVSGTSLVTQGGRHLRDSGFTEGSDSTSFPSRHPIFQTDETSCSLPGDSSLLLPNPANLSTHIRPVMPQQFPVYLLLQLNYPQCFHANFKPFQTTNSTMICILSPRVYLWRNCRWLVMETKSIPCSSSRGSANQYSFFHSKIVVICIFATAYL
jgi:hypothetical protein